MRTGSTNRSKGLTANAVKHAKPREKAYKLSDRDGLYLLVKPTGICKFDSELAPSRIGACGD